MYWLEGALAVASYLRIHWPVSPQGAAEMDAVVTKSIGKSEEFDGQLEILSGPTTGRWIRWRGRADTYASSPKTEVHDLHLERAITDVASYYTYEGSLTTPPCLEGLRWYVLNTDN